MSGQARILDGRAVAAAWQDELAHDVQDVSMRGGRPPGLGVVLVGSRPDSLLYVSRKREACEKVRHVLMCDSVVGLLMLAACSWLKGCQCNACRLQAP